MNAAAPPIASRYFRMALIAALAYVLVVFWATRQYLMDDAYIGLRYVANLWAGHGLVFNPAERIEGVTNIGWLLFLAPLGGIFPLTWLAKLAGLTLLLIGVSSFSWIAWRLTRQADGLLFAAPLPLLIACQRDYLFYSLTGMETALLAAGIGLVVSCSLGKHRSMIIALCCALLYLVRPECVLLYPLAQLLLNGRSATAWKRQVPSILAFVGSILVITLGRWAYYGDLLPNTFVAKWNSPLSVSGGLMALLMGTNRNVPQPFGSLLAFLFLARGISSLWQRERSATAYLTAGTMVGLIFGVYAPLDWTGTGRYFAPYAPAACILLWKGFVDIARWLLSNLLSETAIRRVVWELACVLIILGVYSSILLIHPDSVRRYPGYVMTSASLVEPSQWVRDNLPSECVIATRRLGAIGYYSGRHVFDYMFGLTDRRVASLIRSHGRRFDDPGDDALRDLWRELRPDYLLEDSVVLEKLGYGSGGRTETFEIHGVAYREEKRFAIAEEIDWVLCKSVAD